MDLLLLPQRYIVAVRIPIYKYAQVIVDAHSQKSEYVQGDLSQVREEVLYYVCNKRCFSKFTR